jgi:SAM-dependent methyltransferase
LSSGPELALRATRCAICGTEGNADERWPSTLTDETFTARTFSARRQPDNVHYRIVVCRDCRLVRSDPVLDSAALAALYRASGFDYGSEIASLERTYGEALARIEARLGDGPRSGFADIGCANGFVLGQALRRGWSDVHGVEPSTEAIAGATDEVRPLIKPMMMGPGVFEAGSLGAVTLFQVLDHVADPVTLLEECRLALRPGGVILAWNHNVEAVSARVLGERSPIVDVQHMYLYSLETMRKLFLKAGFVAPDVVTVRNRYSVRYLAHLSPIPAVLKEPLLRGLKRSRLGRTEVRLPLGNLCLTALAPPQPAA